MIFTLITLAAAAFAVGSDIYDVTMTERGLKAGVAVEGFDFLVGPKPTTRALYLRDLGFIALAAVPALFASFAHPAFAFGISAAPVVLGVKHILGGRAWAKLLKK